MKQAVLIFVLFCSAFSAFSETITRFIPYRKGSLWGYSDTAKKLLIQPQFAEAFPFNEYHTAFVKRRSHYVLIDTLGQVLSDSFELVGEIGEGLIAVKQKGRMGYITAKGSMQIPCRYDIVESFKEGLAVVYTNNLAGIIDTKGNYIVSPRFVATSRNYSSGRLLVTENGKNSFIDKNGRAVVLAPDLIPSGGYSEGLAPAYRMHVDGLRDTGYHLLYINLAGEIVLDSFFKHNSYSQYLPFKNGKAALSVKYDMHKEYYFLDTLGKLSKDYSGVQPFNEGHTLAIDGYYLSDNYIIDDRYSITGKVQGRISNAGTFSEGLMFIACDPKGEKNISYGYINTRGRIVIPYQYQAATDFKDGIAAVVEDGQWGFIDLTGKEYWE